MAKPPEPEDIGARPADPYVRARISGPGESAGRTLTLAGLLGDSDRPGRRRLYFNTSLDYYAEFAVDDVLAVEDVPADQSPFVGLDATRVTVRSDARVEYTYARVVGSSDDFDLDIRKAPRAMAGPRPLMAETWEAECPGPSFGGGCPTDFACGTDFDCPSGWTVCKPHTCACETDPPQCRPTDITCRTCDQATCQTCNQATCRTCNQATCRTCGQATCQTCNQATCVSCGGTCHTCPDFDCGPTFAQTHCFTCRAGCNF
jgi:hypothetical protein